MATKKPDASNIHNQDFMFDAGTAARSDSAATLQLIRAERSASNTTWRSGLARPLHMAREYEICTQYW